MAAVTLPPEIIEAILDCIAADYTDSLTGYAAVSRVWQACVEGRTFSRLTLTPERLQTALTSATLFNTATADGCRRFAAVRRVSVKAVLPPYDAEARDRVESDAERAANNAVFTQTVQDAFRLLARGVAANAFAPDAEVALSLMARCPSDSMDYLKRKGERRVGRTRDLLQIRYISSYLDLVGDTREGEDEGDDWTGAHLPLLPMITSFTSYGFAAHWRPSPWRHIAPAACALVASRLPRLRAVNWSFYDNEKRDLAGRRARRTAFAHAIPRLPPSLAKVLLDLVYTVKDQCFEHPIALLDAASYDPTASTDPLSAALGRWARRTTEFVLDATVTTDFWTALAGDADDVNNTNNTVAEGSAENNKPSTPPPLTSFLYVSHNMVSPTGQWLTVPSPPYPDDGEDYDGDHSPYYSDSEFPLEIDQPLPEDARGQVSRAHPNPLLWNQILLASGRAVARLPALRVLRVGIPGSPDNVCEVLYRTDDFAAHDRTVAFASYPFEPRACENAHRHGAKPTPLSVPGLFEPDADVVQTWRAATKTQSQGVEAGIQIVNITSKMFTATSKWREYVREAGIRTDS